MKKRSGLWRRNGCCQASDFPIPPFNYLFDEEREFWQTDHFWNFEFGEFPTVTVAPDGSVAGEDRDYSDSKEDKEHVSVGTASSGQE